MFESRGPPLYTVIACRFCDLTHCLNPYLLLSWFNIVRTIDSSTVTACGHSVTLPATAVTD